MPQAYIPLREAAKKHNLEEQVLTQLITAGMIEAKEQNGETLVAVDKSSEEKEPQTKGEIIAAKFGDLIGQPITLSEAAKKYDVPRDTLKTWKNVNKYFAPITLDSYPACFDESEIAYLADIYHDRQKTGSRAPLLDRNGLPYKLRLPELARYRRKKKKFSSKES